MTRADRSITTPESGFSLLEIMAAVTIFSVIVIAFVHLREDASELAWEANRTRIMKYLAGRQMGRLQLGIQEDGTPFDFTSGEWTESGDFSEVDEKYSEYYWSATVNEVYAVGIDSESTDVDDAEILFKDDSVGQPAGEGAPEPIKLYRIRLAVGFLETPTIESTGVSSGREESRDADEEPPASGADPDTYVIETFVPIPPDEDETGG